MDRERAIAIIEHYREKLTEARFSRLERVVSHRMRGLTVVLEKTYDQGNRSAVYRTAEGHGLLDVHLVRPDYATKPHARQVSRGAEKWLHIHGHQTASGCAGTLRASGFKLYAADLDASRPLATIDFSRPTALVFGNEKYGISAEMRAECDGAFFLPMRGLAQSFNISVAAAIAIAHGREARERAIGATTDLDEATRLALFVEYLEKAPGWIARVPAAELDRVLPQDGSG